MLSPEALADALITTYLAPRERPTWTEDYVESVQARRKAANGTLMYDRLLHEAAIDCACFC